MPAAHNGVIPGSNPGGPTKRRDSSPAVEATDLKSVQGGFESLLSHQLQKEKKMTNVLLKYTGMTAVILGAILTSLRIDPLNIFFLNLGALAYLIWSLRIREWSLVAVNGTLLAIYIIGAVLSI